MIRDGGDEDFDIWGVSDFLEELAAMAAGGGGDGEIAEVGLGIKGEVGDEELLGMDGVVEGEAGEFEVDAEEDPAAGSQSDGADVEVGYRWTSQILGGIHQRWQELRHRQPCLLRHRFCLRGFDHEFGPFHLWNIS